MDNPEKFLSCLEDNDLFGEDNLYYVQYLMHKRRKQSIENSIKEYAEKRSTQPIQLMKIKRRKLGWYFGFIILFIILGWISCIQLRSEI